MAMNQQTTEKYLLEMLGISKEFSGVKALKHVNFRVRPGTVHALLGENGAGKSTLMKCLFGIYKRDAGRILLRGEEVNFQTPHDALINGISMVHQELEQVPDMNVMENVWLGRYPQKFGLIDSATMYRETKKMLRALCGDIEIDPKQKLTGLTVSKRQMVDIAKAISYRCDVITLDEPTSSLNEKEVEVLLEIIAQLKKQGKGIIYISHKMEEIFRIADDITIMRDGEVVSTDPAADINVDIVIRRMVGREMTNRFPVKTNQIGANILEVKNLNDRKHRIHDISFTLKEGEILGIAGLLGAGRTELLETIFNLRNRENGEIILRGNSIKTASPQAAIQNGFALCTEERRFNGIFPELSVAFNTIISNVDSYRNRFGWLTTNHIRTDTERMISVMHTKTSSMNTKIRFLSGGNQQKVIIGRWLLRNPDIFLMDDPTRGIDVGAKYEIYQLIFKLAEEGKGIIVCSSEMAELIGICDRILVLSSGYLAGEYDLRVCPEKATQENILRDATKYV